VANQSAPPPPPPGGNLKFVALGLVFLVAAVGLWIAVGKEDAAPPPAASVAPPPEPARVNPMAEPDLELEAPEPEPDAAVAVVAPTEPKKPKGGGNRGDDWDCVGDLKGAAAVINEQRPQVRACYERRLKVNNILQGDLRLRLTVGANGKVQTTSISGSLNDSEVNACVKKLAASWTFETPSGGSCAVVQVPFQFSPKP
jgi:TonB family protein